MTRTRIACAASCKLLHIYSLDGKLKNNSTQQVGVLIQNMVLHSLVYNSVLNIKTHGYILPNEGKKTMMQKNCMVLYGLQ